MKVPVSNVVVTPNTTDLLEFNSSVSLSCSSSGSSLSYVWLNGSSEVTDSERVQLGDGGSTLTIVNVTRFDQGPFSCRVFNPISTKTSDPVWLSISLPVSNVVVTPNTTDLLEFNSSVSLSCSSSGSSLSYVWLNGSSEVTDSERVQLGDGGSTLTIVNVTRFDQGPFSCRVFNPISTKTSDPVWLSISYGPENTKLTLSPLNEYYEEGSDISLTCSAVSRPSAMFQWFLNGESLSHTGPKLTLNNIQINASGNYSCRAYNNKTMRYQASQPSAVTVLGPVSNVVVTPNTTDLLEFNSSVSLSCSSSGSSLSYVWLNGSSEVTDSERVQLGDGGSTLTIVNVTRFDQGPFSCRVFNPISTKTSDPVWLSISYGPERVTIVGPNSSNVGACAMLYCSATSAPPATFTWLFNGNPTDVRGAVYIIPSSSSSHHGRFTRTL
ncbi:cell adhesion molecule CEACAM5-like [Diretmus argenteus]